jgi:ankyrin repeat protein
MAEIADLIDAAMRGDAARVRDLVAATPSLAQASDAEGATALHYAALHGYRDIVRLLIAAGADVNARDGRFNATPAGWAIEYLRELGGCLAMEIEDVLFAIRQEDVEWAVRLLRRLPVLATCRDREGTPLADHATRAGNREIVAAFRDAAQRANAG